MCFRFPTYILRYSDGDFGHGEAFDDFNAAYNRYHEIKEKYPLEPVYLYTAMVWRDERNNGNINNN